jgi:hypothetical protein
VVYPLKDKSSNSFRLSFIYCIRRTLCIKNMKLILYESQKGEKGGEFGSHTVIIAEELCLNCVVKKRVAKSINFFSICKL